MTTYANPGAIADVAADVTYLEATWGNAARDRLVNNFATAALRTAAITVPVVGMVSCINDDATDLLAFQQYCGPTDGWQRPWNLPWGLIPGREVSSTSLSQATISTVVDVTGMTTGSITYLANRRQRISWRLVIQATVATDRLQVALTDNAGTILATTTWVPSSTNAIVVNGEVSHAPGAGAFTYKLRAQRLTGTGTFTASGSASDPAQLTVEDIGPTGAPA